MSRDAGVFRAHIHSPGSEKTTTGTPRERIQAGIRAYGPFYDHRKRALPMVFIWKIISGYRNLLFPSM
ncbi:MAG: hypothetical protein KDK34_23585, partial [Leptospiraceae bacterium]|nr:hypothetical protein [Leptospiraceae bacterium]